MATGLPDVLFRWIQYILFSVYMLNENLLNAELNC